jgi:hypothetical protein
VESKNAPVRPKLPATESVRVGVDDPIPTFPLARTVKNEVLVEEATLKIELVEPDTPRTLKLTVDEVALIPVTVPSSMKSPDESVVGDVQRARSPVVPPEREPEIPSEDVATQRVDVPVVWRTIPAVPEAFVESRKRPERVRLVVVALVVDALVAANVVIVPDAAVSDVIVVVARVTVDVAVRVPATRLEVVALVAVRLVKNPVIEVRRLEKKLVLVALVVDALVAKRLVAEALVNTDDDPLRLANVPVVELRVVIVPDAAVSDVIVVVARVDTPVTERVPVA